MVGDRTAEAVANPPPRVRGKAVAVRRVEVLDRLHEPEGPLLHEIEERGIGPRPALLREGVPPFRGLRDRLRVPLGAEAPRLRYPAPQGDFLVGLQQGNPPDVPTIPPQDGLVRLPGLGADAPTGGARGVPPSASAILAC